MRLFTAVPLGEEACASLARAVDGVTALPGAPRWIGRDRWHVTLVFLGEIEDELVPRLYRELETATEAIRPFTLRIAGAGAFPPSGSPKVLWAGLSGDVERLEALARTVRRAARRARVDVERRAFNPHLTLGRWRARDTASRSFVAELTTALRRAGSTDFAVAGYSLYRSHPPTQPFTEPRYERLATWPLVN